MNWKTAGHWTGTLVAMVLSPMMPLLQLVLKGYFDMQAALSGGSLILQSQMLQFMQAVAANPTDVTHRVMPLMVLVMAISIVFMLACRSGFGYIFSQWDKTLNTSA